MVFPCAHSAKPVSTGRASEAGLQHVISVHQQRASYLSSLGLGYRYMIEFYPNLERNWVHLSTLT